MDTLSGHLLIASKILSSRLQRPHQIGVSILEPDVSSSTISKNHFGHSIGYFSIAIDKVPCFLLFHRDSTRITGRISSIRVVFVNHEYTKIPEKILSEITRFGLGEVDDNTRRSILILSSKEPLINHLSIMIEILETAFHPDYLEDSSPRKVWVIEVPSKNRFYTHRDKTIELASCEERGNEPEEVGRYILALRSRGFKFLYYDIRKPATIPRDFDVLQVRVENHFVYAVNYPASNIIYFLFPHNPFSVSNQQKILSQLAPRFPGCRCHTTNTYGFPERCNSVDMLKASILMLIFQPHGLISIKFKDIESMSSQLETFITSTDVRKDHPESSQAGSQTSTISLKVDYVLDWHFGLSKIPGRHLRPTTLSRFNYESVMNTGSALTEVRKRFDAIPKDEVPSIPTGSYNGSSESILQDTNIFSRAFASVTETWKRYVDVRIVNSLRLSQLSRIADLDVTMARFTVLPIVDMTAKTYLMLVFDNMKLEFLFFNAEFNAEKTKSLFDLVTGVIDTHLPDYCGQIVKLTSYYHKKYPLIHLLFGLYTMGNLFKYAVMFPKRIIYSEYHFRLYCFLFLYEKQLSNHEYNATRYLLNDDGSLKSGARFIFINQVNYERIVVPTDTCMFCRKRGFDNLGRHMSMRHGGQAQIASHSRLQLSDDDEDVDVEN